MIRRQLLLCLLLVAVRQAFPQTSAAVNGTITDSSGAVVSGATLTITSADTGVKRVVTTGEDGLYHFPLLASGVYSLSVQKAGFKQVTRDDLRLELSQVARVDFTLSPGVISESVQVEASAPLLESDTSSVGQVIETKAVSDLPLNGRNFAQLAILGPGVTGVGYSASGTIGSGTRPDDMRPGTELFSNGNREQSNNFMLDGVDNNFRRNGLITLRPSSKQYASSRFRPICFKPSRVAIREQRLTSSRRSGSNAFHGSVYEFLRNARLDARNFFSRPGSAKPAISAESVRSKLWRSDQTRSSILFRRL